MSETGLGEPHFEGFGKCQFARIFPLVVGCRRPTRLLGSPTCDGPDRHRRVCSESTRDRNRGLDDRMDADSRASRGSHRGAPACRRTGDRRPRHPVETGAGPGDHGRARAARREPGRVDRGVQRRQRRARPDRRRARQEPAASQDREEEPEGLADADRDPPARALRHGRERLDARRTARLAEPRRRHREAGGDPARVEARRADPRGGEEVQGRGRGAPPDAEGRARAAGPGRRRPGRAEGIDRGAAQRPATALQLGQGRDRGDGRRRGAPAGGAGRAGARAR